MFDWLRDLMSLGRLETPPHAEPCLSSRPLSGNFFRFHSEEHLHLDEFWKAFLDGDWKWKAQERYAGEYLNCGHFFGLTAEGARAEAEFYDAAKNRPLLEVKAAFANVLDLTDLGCMRFLVAQRQAELPSPGTVHLDHLLAFLTDERRGGNPFTDDIGYWACANHYDAVLFYSARALPPDVRARVNTGNPYAWELDEACGFTAEESALKLQQDLSFQNLVVLSGARLTSAISEFRVDAGPWRVNPYHNNSTAQLDEVLHRNHSPFDSDYQREQSESIITVQGNQTVIPQRPPNRDKDNPPPP